MTQPNQENGEGGFSTTLNKKWGPFPVWLYLVAVGLAIFLFIYLRRQNSSKDTSTSDTGTQSSSTVPPFINQVYTNTTPPDSSTTSVATKNPTQIIDLKTAGTFDAIAKRWNMTIDQLIKLNPQLANKYENTGKTIPRGTKIVVVAPQGGGGTLR